VDSPTVRALQAQVREPTPRTAASPKDLYPHETRGSTAFSAAIQRNRNMADRPKSMREALAKSSHGPSIVEMADER